MHGDGPWRESLLKTQMAHTLEIMYVFIVVMIAIKYWKIVTALKTEIYSIIVDKLKYTKVWLTKIEIVLMAY